MIDARVRLLKLQELGKRVSLWNGSTVTLRPLAAGDEAAIANWFAGLGPATRYARFLAQVTHLDPRTQAALARVDHLDHEAVVAVAVADSWRGQGIATMRLRDVATRARAARIGHLTAACMATNHTVIRLLSRLGPTRISVPEAGVVHLQIDLRSAQGQS